MNKVKCLFIIALAIGLLDSNAYSQNRGKSNAKKNTTQKSGKTPPFTSIRTETKVAEPWRLLNSKEKLIEISTSMGVMIAKLYDYTPLHRDNFVKLVNQKFYDSLLFHRVIDGFMIQGGDPTSKNAASGTMLGNGSAPGERIPAEFRPDLIHKKGAIAAARDNNPQKASSNCQFYIVQGKPVAEQELNTTLESRVKPSNPAFTYTKTQKEVYSKIGGTPFLDQGYTVFGEVISGLDVIDKIARAPKAPGDRPNQDILMTVRLLN